MSDPSVQSESAAYLIWEHADHETWWLARSHDQSDTYVIAKDSVTAHTLVLRQGETASAFKVIVAVPVRGPDGADSAIAEAKRLSVKWIGDPQSAVIKNSVNRWRALRWSKIAVREVPLALASLSTGILLALIVSTFFIATDLTGWTMVIVGTVFGAMSGWVLKWTADQKFTSLMGPTGRFATVTGSATLGALITVVLFFMLFGTQ